MNVQAEPAPFEVTPENDFVSNLRYLHTPTSFKAMLQAAGLPEVTVGSHPADVAKATMAYGGKRKQYLSFTAQAHA